MKVLISGNEFVITETKTQWIASSADGKLSYSLKFSKADAPTIEELKTLLEENLK